jgi:hypothetical protein
LFQSTAIVGQTGNSCSFENVFHAARTWRITRFARYSPLSSVSSSWRSRTSVRLMDASGRSSHAAPSNASQSRPARGRWSACYCRLLHLAHLQSERIAQRRPVAPCTVLGVRVDPASHVSQDRFRLSSCELDRPRRT